MKNKARLSIMTAFSFGKPLKHLINDQLIPLKRTAIIVFCVRVTSQNETSKGAPEPTIMTPRVVLYCQSSSEGGIVLFRLLVSVYIRAEKQHVFKVYVHVPGTKNERRTKKLETRDINEAIKQAIEFER